MPVHTLVTGGASGLGRAIALEFARQGHVVCITDLNNQNGILVEAELKALSPESFFYSASVTSEEDWLGLRGHLKQIWGGLDILVNNAGIAGPQGGIDQISSEVWQKVMDINVMGVVLGCRTFSPWFMEQQGGYIVNVASAAGLMNAPRMSAYNVSKAAVVSLSETLRVELAPFNCGVSVLCPVFFKTNIVDSMGASEEERQFVLRQMEKSEVDADDIARMVSNAIVKQQFYILPHREIRSLWRFKRFFPDSFVKKMANFDTRRKSGKSSPKMS